MAKEDLMEFPGTAEALLRHAMFRGRLGNGRGMLTHISDKMRKNRIRALVGDKVTVEMTAHDLIKGRIIHRLK